MSTTGRGTLAETLGTVVVFGAGLLLYVVSVRGAMASFQRSWFFERGPGGNPPWYFIGQDLVDGCWAAGALFVLLVFTLVAVRFVGAIAWTAFGINAISFVSRVGSALNVWLHTDGAWRGPQARSSWSSFEQYLESQRTAFNVSTMAAVFVAGCSLVMFARSLKRSQPNA